MDWVQVLVMVLGNAAWILPMFFWNRTESRADARYADSKIEAMRALVDSIKEEGRIFREQWMAESKEFHARLCGIEERRAKEILEELRKQRS